MYTDIKGEGNKNMRWIIVIVVLIIQVFLWLIVRSAAKSVDEDTQAMYDEEQSNYIDNYFKEKKGQKDQKDQMKDQDQIQNVDSGDNEQ